MTLLSTDLPPKIERVERSVDRNVESQLRTVGHSEPLTGLMEKNRLPADRTSAGTNTRRST